MNDKEKNEIELMDLLLLMVSNKRRLALIFISTLITAYLSILFFVKPEYTATATIISSGGNNPMSGLMSLAGKFSGVLPSITGEIGNDAEFALYNTVLYSRTSMENVILKYDLMKLYKFKNQEVGVKALRKLINTDVNFDNAYTISAKFRSPQLASDIANYLVQYLNEKVIEINITKSKNDRIFLEKRVDAIKDSLKKSEEILKDYQEKSGVIEAKTQTTKLIERLSTIESEMRKKDLEVHISKELLGEQSNEFKKAQVISQELHRNLDEFKNTRTSNLNRLPLDSIPKSMLEYYRLYRDVQMYGTMLEYIIPIFEQAKFNEQKMTPVLNVIDKAIPPIKRTSPQRTVTAILIALFLTILVFLQIVFREILSKINNPKFLQIKKEIFNKRV